MLTEFFRCILIRGSICWSIGPSVCKFIKTRLTHFFKPVMKSLLYKIIKSDSKISEKLLSLLKDAPLACWALFSYRNAKLIHIYDWKITGKWEGTGLNVDSVAPTHGTFKIDGLSDENDIDEVDVEICTADTSDEGYAFKSLVRNIGVAYIHQSLRSYVDELKHFTKDQSQPDLD